MILKGIGAPKTEFIAIISIKNRRVKKKKSSITEEIKISEKVFRVFDYKNTFLAGTYFRGEGWRVAAIAPPSKKIRSEV